MAPKSAGENSGKNVEEGANSISDDEARSYSASSISVASATSAELSSDDPDDVDRNEHGSFTHDHEQPQNGMPKPGTLASSTLESPKVQVMERPQESSEYRIPSHVFATNNSTTPKAEWSSASNESLFSIHNMSFTLEEFNLLLKSGELGMYGDLLKSGELGKIGELPPPLRDALKSWKEQQTTMHPDMHKSGEQITVPSTVVKNDDSRSEVINRKGAEPSLDEIPCPATVSRDTEACAPSFASQVRGGKSARSSSVSLRAGKSERSSSVTLNTGRVDQAKESDTSNSYKEEKTKEQGEASSSWLSCFCCSCCGGSGKTS